jgi:hypothetical protein
MAYMLARPGSEPRTWVGQAWAGSLQWWGRCQRTWATSAGVMSSQVWPKARPANWPVAHTSAPALAVAPRPTARSWSPGLVNGGASGGRCPPGGRGGQPSCHIRLTPRNAADAVASGALGGEEGPVLLQVSADQEPQGGVTTAVVRPGLLPMAVSATTGEAASPICIELVDWLDDPAGCAALARRPTGHARVGTLVAHLGGSFQVPGSRRSATCAGAALVGRVDGPPSSLGRRRRTGLACGIDSYERTPS